MDDRTHHDPLVTPALERLDVGVLEQLRDALTIVGYDGMGAPLFRWQVTDDHT